MQKFHTILLAVFFTMCFLHKTTAQFNPGDTVRVRVHDDVDMTWYGNYDVLGVFPDTGISFRKIIMTYTMGCASGGCSDWDYTTKVELLHRTGALDSSLHTHSWFSVNGLAVDTLFAAYNPTFKTSWNTVDNVTDTVWNPLLTVLFYDSASVPPPVYDSSHVYICNYWNYTYDATGLVIDSIFVQADDTLINVGFYYYQLFPVIVPFELARVITPYGGYMKAGQQGFNNSWTFAHEFDVTDFSLLLRDSLIIRAFYDGWSSGFSITLDFEMIVGTPPHNTKRIENLWRGGFAYQNSAHFETNYLPARQCVFEQQEVAARLRIIPSGHGFDNNVNCAEFCPRSYYIKINNNQVYNQLMWDNACGFNPIYPQAGTWIYNRANWCPGLQAKIYQHDITNYISHADTVIIDMDIQDYAWSGSQTPYYYIDAQLFTFGTPNFSLDAEVYDIISPTAKDAFARLNPICHAPKVVIRNSGAQTLNSLLIEYGYKGQTPLAFSWSGSLPFLETDTVVLPGNFYQNGMTDVFFVHVKNPNGATDENLLNDYMESFFSIPDIIFENQIVVEMKTNNAGWQNRWTITDTDGQVVALRENMSNNTVYKDTIQLQNGQCYIFELTDAGGNGLSFFVGNEGTGYVRLRKANSPAVLKSFNANFGSKIVYPFTIDNNAAVYSPDEDFGFNIYPNPTKNEFILETGGIEINNISVQSINGKRQVLDIIESNDDRIKLDTRNLTSGFYFVIIETASAPAVLKLLILH